jgi:hypothetical protein
MISEQIKNFIEKNSEREKNGILKFTQCAVNEKKFHVVDTGNVRVDGALRSW